MASSSSSLPPNVHISNHPCIRAKLSQLRSTSTDARDFKALVHEIATMVACEALAKAFDTVETGTVSLHGQITSHQFPEFRALVPPIFLFSIQSRKLFFQHDR
jgi:uracil phosphoribosyltransferase